MSREGFCGIRLPFIGLSKLPDITTFEYCALFRRLADLDWHVHPHVDGEDLPKILPVLEASGVKIGRPDAKSGINWRTTQQLWVLRLAPSFGMNFARSAGDRR